VRLHHLLGKSTNPTNNYVYSSLTQDSNLLLEIDLIDFFIYVWLARNQFHREVVILAIIKQEKLMIEAWSCCVDMYLQICFFECGIDDDGPLDQPTATNAHHVCHDLERVVVDAQVARNGHLYPIEASTLFSSVDRSIDE
jgi:hypothetical protein